MPVALGRCVSGCSKCGEMSRLVEPLSGSWLELPARHDRAGGWLDQAELSFGGASEPQVRGELFKRAVMRVAEVVFNEHRCPDR